ncbi:UDP-forming cellulose synthase catalytic subunit [Marinospirillum sp.]|uniref:UDP-forming cellulose synthase catalytic subunit n=1 Tax=Marinospirillum sp. TaxID=2183934 RepID=UPI00286FEAA0|nr:UDP-forming cellulose synthase catalytic subunit [Marinospirillum sp.]MDR9468993.1 UDP-forming cellulose synthase catalytic subunit [Marinospirillum sp.]
MISMQGERLLGAGFVAFLLLACVLILLPMDSLAQLVSGVTLLSLMWVGQASQNSNRWGDYARLLVLLIGCFLSLRYLTWRGIYTLSAADWATFIAIWLLFVAEIYSTSMHLLGCLVNAAPLKRPLLSIKDLPEDTELPQVDVLIPSYNEDPELLEITLRAALMMHYPAGRLSVYLLDDGGTDQKVNSPDPVAAKSALNRRKTLQALCKQLGCQYLTRPRNEKAKAGNLNHALQYVSGDLVVVLDADHVPTVDFLDHTVPWFVRHPDVFLVQTPHFMVNPDPIDRNLLRSFSRMPSENDMFYQTIQRGLDFWSASFFCGSAAVLRRKHLDEVGGLSGETITEDCETAFSLHSKGYRSIYVDKPMVAGLAPETFAGFVTQRMRWAQGMTQILLLKKPYMAPGLKWHQRLGYMSSIFFWMFPFARSVFLLSPLAYLYFGMQVYNASLMEILAYTLPHIIGTYMVSSLLFGRTRWPLISELYEIMQCVFSLVAIVKVFINPRKPSFMVTPKGDTLDQDFISPLAKPFYVLFGLLILGFITGFYRFWADPLTRELTSVVLLWNLFNFLTVFAALGALLERKQKRAAPRLPIREQGYLRAATGQKVACKLLDISANGSRLGLDEALGLKAGDIAHLDFWSHALNRWIELPLIIRATLGDSGYEQLGVEFLAETHDQKNDIVALSFADSARWLYFQNRRARPIPFMHALRMVVSLIWVPVKAHLRLFITQVVNKRLNTAIKTRPQSDG